MLLKLPNSPFQVWVTTEKYTLLQFNVEARKYIYVFVFSPKLIHFENAQVLLHDKVSSGMVNLEKKTKRDKIMICQVAGAHEDPNIKLRTR